MDDRSERNLVGVHPDLVRLTRRAAEITTRPFIVTDGLRTPEEQAKMISQGVAWTKNSRHFTGHAVDIVALHPSKGVTYDWDALTDVANAFREASKDERVPVQWGAIFDRNLDQITGKLVIERSNYRRRFFAEHKREPRIDGPHFQLPWKEYPL